MVRRMSHVIALVSVVVFITFALALGGTAAPRGNVAGGAARGGNAASSGANAASSGAVSVQLAAARVEVERDADGNAVFDCRGVQWLNAAGEPNVPWQVMSVLLPPGAELESVQAALDGARYEAVKGRWTVLPAPPPAINLPAGVVAAWPEGKRIVDGRDADVYEAEALWPRETVRLVGAGRLRKWRLADVAVPLVRYNPVSGSLERLVGGMVRVTFADRFKGNVRPRASAELASRGGESRARRAAVNFEQVAPQYEALVGAADGAEPGAPGVEAVSIGEPGYVIITTSAIESASSELANFVTNKALYGYDVHVMTEADFGGGTGDTAAGNIRAWLAANYVLLNIEYVLLVGDPRPSTGTVPMKMTWPRHNDSTYQEAPSDFYYADLTGNWDKDGDGYYGEWGDDFGAGGVDRYAEVLVGRIPYYGSTSDLDGILAKIIDYNSARGSATEWRHDVLLPMEPSDESTPGYHLGEAIKDHWAVPEGWSYHRVYEENYGLVPPPETTPCTTSNVTSVWSAGTYGLVVWWTHGSSASASGIMDIWHVPSLNDVYPAFTFQVSCLNSYPEATNNLSYELLQHGGIATIGATRVSWYYVGQTFFSGSPSNSGMSYEYSKRIIRDEMSCGEALFDLKQDLTPGSSAIWMNFVVFNIYGDPSTFIDPHVVVFYVNGTTGDDGWDGLAPAWDGTHGPKRTIQAGIDAAGTGSVVVVAAGTYSGSGNTALDFGGKPVMLRSADGAASTIIDCEGTARAFTFTSGETTATIVQGFTIQNGFAGSGGAIYCAGASPSIDECIMTGGTATDGAAVACVSGAEPVLTNCVIAGNTASDEGGGLYCYTSDPRLVNCTIVENTASGTYASGIYCRSSSPVLANCIVWDNEPQAFYLRTGSAPTLNYCDVQGGWTGAGTGNIDADPLFAPDWHLFGYSPCRDAGTATGAPIEDIDGEARLTGDVDIGADECVDSDGDKLGDWSEVHSFGTDPADRDTDDDGMHDGYEVRYSFNPHDLVDGAQNDDTDLLFNYEEAVLESDPYDAGSPALVYVDIDNAGDPAQDGSAEHPFASIQPGIDAAGSPGVVVIRPGTYVETVVMAMRVALIGSGSEQTAISAASAGLGPTVNFLDGTDGVLAELTIAAGTNDYDVCVRMYNAAISLRGCIFAGAWNGIGMNGYGSARVVDCLLADNTRAATWIGGTVEAAFVNCTVANNATDGVVLVGAGRVMLWNSVFWGNGDDLDVGGSTPVTASCCDIGDGDFVGSNGNFSADPLFVAGPVHGYYLSCTAAGQLVDSPCIDAGNTTAATLALDGRTTRTDGAGDTGVVDVGCHAAVAVVITSISHGSDDIVIEWNAQAGVSYVVEWSEDRQTWTAVSVGETGTWTDVGVLAGQWRRYYRVRVE